MIRLKSLLLEVSIDQLKTQFVDTGKITDSEFVEIVDATGGKTAYATWLTKMVANKIIKPEDLYKYNTYFKIFDRRKREYPFNDINQYKSAQDIAQFIAKSVELANKEQQDPSQQKGVAKEDRYIQFKIGEIEGFTVYELPKGRTDLYGASCELGSGTEWCTATGNTKTHFERYISTGPLFIFIKPGSKEKYQFSYENEQFMDKNDNPITDNPSPVLIKLFQFIESRYSKYRVPLRVKILNFPNTLTKDDLNVNGNLDLHNMPITKLPDGLQVHGDLNLSYTQITSLPASFRVGRSLNLRDTPIAELPEELRVGGSLILNNTKIDKLPVDLQVGRDLDLTNTRIKSLPANLRINGYLDLTNTRIKSLPANLQVNDTLYLLHSQLESIPNNLQIGGDLYIKYTPISEKYSESEIRKMIEEKGGSIEDRII